MQSFIHSNQPQEILLQVLFLDHELSGRAAGIDEQAVDLIRVCHRSGMMEGNGAIGEDFGGQSGFQQHLAGGLHFPNTQQKSPLAVSLQLRDIQFLQQASLVDNPDPPGDA